MGVVLIKYDGTMYGLHLDTFDDSLAWIKALRLVLYGKQRRGSQAEPHSADVHVRLRACPSSTGGDHSSASCSCCIRGDQRAGRPATEDNLAICSGRSIRKHPEATHTSLHNSGCHDNSAGTCSSCSSSPSSPLRIGFNGRDQVDASSAGGHPQSPNQPPQATAMLHTTDRSLDSEYFVDSLGCFYTLTSGGTGCVGRMRGRVGVPCDARSFVFHVYQANGWWESH